MVADLGTFSPLRTSLIVDGIWLYVREKNTALNGIWPIQYTDKTEYPYVGFYDRQGGPGNESRSEIISTNFRFITRIPRIGLVTTLTWQMIWLYKYRTLYNGSTGENVWPYIGVEQTESYIRSPRHRKRIQPLRLYSPPPHRNDSYQTLINHMVC